MIWLILAILVVFGAGPALAAGRWAYERAKTLKLPAMPTVDTRVPAWKVAVLMVGTYAAAGGVGWQGCTVHLPTISIPWVIGAPPPFKTDKLAVLIVEETEQRTQAIDALAFAIESAVEKAGGVHRRLDKDQTDLSKDEPWVQEAWKAKGPPPWIVAANARRGVSQALTAESLKALEPLGVK